MRLAALLFAVAALAAPAPAQDVQEDGAPPVDCTTPEGMQDIALCAAAALERAEADMEHAYRLALTRAEVLDGEWALRGGAPGGLVLHDTLATAQAAWATHSEAHCAAVSLARVEEPEIDIALTLCLERQARLRETELRRLSEPN